VVSTQAWGLDHGTWSVLKHVFPEANVPVVQLSIDTSKPASWHLEVGRIIGKVREQQVLIVASGNIVHNLREINWSVDAAPHPAGVRFHDYVVQAIENGDDDALVNYAKHPDAAYAVPTPEHFLPLLYTIVDGDVFSSLSMYSVSFG
jgi:4,5-DOPA dioxygenase extradiol